MKKGSSITYTLDLGIAGEVDVDITYSLSPFVAATMYDRNGDPGSPAEGGEIELLTAKVGDIDVSWLVGDFLERDEDFYIACVVNEEDEQDCGRDYDSDERMFAA